MKFYRPNYDNFSNEKKAKIHASKDGLTTLCGIKINQFWEETDRFEWGVCKKCEKIFPTIKKHGRQTNLSFGQFLLGSSIVVILMLGFTKTIVGGYLRSDKKGLK